MKTKRILKCASLAVIGVMIMSLLTACNTRDNRAWIENQVSEVSKVYKTEKLEELFNTFPNGFTIKMNSDDNKELLQMELKGDSNNKVIRGKLELFDITKNDTKAINTSSVSYENGQYHFSNPEFIKKYWLKENFLFQEKIINKDYLSKQKVSEYSYNVQDGVYNISYKISDSKINTFLNLKDRSTLMISSFNKDKNWYSYSVSISTKNTTYMELIRGELGDK